jgi:hypothetical protein
MVVCLGVVLVYFQACAPNKNRRGRLRVGGGCVPSFPRTSSPRERNHQPHPRERLTLERKTLCPLFGASTRESGHCSMRGARGFFIRQLRHCAAYYYS